VPAIRFKPPKLRWLAESIESIWGASMTTPTSTWQASASPPGWPRCSRRS
jgi:hypothetical protein